MARLSANEDNYRYICFVGPQCLEKALTTLTGFLEGVLVDNKIDLQEAEGLRQWMQDYAEYSEKSPFNEIYLALETILSEEQPDIEDVKDVLWQCAKYLHNDTYFNSATIEMQRLQGMLAGILADGVATKEELKGLSSWLQDHENLKGCWPFDEVESLIVSVLKDGVVDQKENLMLKAFFSEFINTETHKSISISEINRVAPISGICALCPEVEFSQKIFCFTGKFKKGPRKTLAALTEKLGGTFTNSLSTNVNYLVIGSEGNESWAFSCYGRKVEEAMEFRKKGHNIILVHEFDYCDAVEDKLANEA